MEGKLTQVRMLLLEILSVLKGCSGCDKGTVCGKYGVSSLVFFAGLMTISLPD